MPSHDQLHKTTTETTAGRDPTHGPDDATGQAVPVARPTDAVLTRWVDKAPKTGNPYVDEGLGCDDGKQKGHCFLAPSVRQRLVGAYHGRVNAAQSSYGDALTQLRVEELLKKEPAKSELMMEILLDVIGALTAKVALSVFHLARGGGHAIEGVIAEATALSQGLSLLSDETFKQGVTMAVALGKKKVTATPENDRSHAPVGTKKAANIAYIDLLQNKAAEVYEYMREGMIADVDDAHFLVLFDSFEAKHGHSIGAYKAALSQKLGRFATSGVGDIGVTDNEKFSVVGIGIDSAFKHETHAFWVTMPGAPRLGMYKRAYQPQPELVREISGLDRPKTPYEKAADKLARMANQEGFTFERFVPDEFVEAAVKLHTARWGYVPLAHAAGPHELMQMGAKEEQP